MRVRFGHDLEGDAIAIAELPERPAFPGDDTWARASALRVQGNRFTSEAIGAGDDPIRGEWADVSREVAVSEFLSRAFGAGAEVCTIRDESAVLSGRCIEMLRPESASEPSDLHESKFFVESLLETDRETMIEAWTVPPDDASRASDFDRAVDHLRQADPRELIDGAKFVIGSHGGVEGAIFTVRSGEFHFRRVGTDTVVEIELPDPGYVAKAVREAVEADHTEVIYATNQ